MRARSAVLLAVFAARLCADPASACESGTVRDAAFSKPRENLRLCVFGSGKDPAAAIAGRLSDWLAGPGAALNLVVEAVDADKADINWAAYAVPSAPPHLPATALIGTSAPAAKPFIVKAWEPAPSAEELQRLADSRAAARIREALGRSWAVLLHVPGDTPGVGEALKAVCARWAEAQAPGLSVVTLNRDDPEARLLCAFAGLPRDRADWIGVVFGKGKLLAPPVRGAEIGAESLNRLLEELAVPCTCLQESTRFGADLPMAWDESVTQAALALSVPQAANNAPVGTRLTRFLPLALGAILVAAGAGAAAYLPARRRQRAD